MDSYNYAVSFSEENRCRTAFLLQSLAGCLSLKLMCGSWGSQRSPDISAEGDPEAEKIKHTKQNIAKLKGAAKAMGKLKKAFSAQQILQAYERVRTGSFHVRPPGATTIK